jgi:hypothetical protein
LQLHNERRAQCEAAQSVAPATQPGTDPRHTTEADTRVLRVALELFYLWATFAPLSRGTAACGYAAFCATLLAFGRQVTTPSLLPSGKQLDWEAILAVDFEAFYDEVKGWFTLEKASTEILCAVRHPWVEESGPSDGQVAAVDCVCTLRDMLDVLCLPYEG